MNRSSASPIRVLHVDDDAEFVDVVAAFLERGDDQFSVETASSGRECLERLADDRVDCVVSDYDMPTMDGIELLTAVREEYPDLPFILFTGKGSEEVARDAIAADVTDYLQKQTGTEQYQLLANRIRNGVAQYRAERRAARQERRLSILQRLNQTLVQASTREEIEAAIPEIMTSFEPYSLAWMGEFDAGPGRIRPLAVAAVDVDPSSLSGGIASDDLADELRDAETVTVEEPAAPPPALEDRETPSVDCEALVAVPISYQGHRHCVLGLYAAESGGVDSAERALLDELAGDVAQALDAAETRQTLERHQTAVEAVPEGVFVLDETATFVLINEHAAALVDRSPADVRGESFQTFIDEGIFDADIVDWYLESVRTMLSSSTDQTEARYETEMTLQDGSARVTEVHLTLRPFEDDYRGTVGIIRDVTEEKQREQALAENKRRYRRLLENAPIPIILYDADGVLVYANGATVEFVGASGPAEIIGQSALEFIHPDDADLATARMQRVLEDREPVDTVELSLVDLDGDRRDVVLTSIPVTYRNEPAAQVVLKDITEQKGRERELERQRDRLDEFASLVSHDLRNPLNVARGQLELHASECSGDHLEAVERAHDRMETLVDDLLQFARIGNTAIEPERVDVAELAETTWRSVQTADATLVTEVERSVRGDPGFVRQLLENLFRNAVEHGGSDVEVTVGEVTDGDGLFVADDGPGVPEDERGLLFDSGYSTKSDGSGFGLAIVREVADAHDWEVQVRDTEQRGARFEITGVDVE